MRWPSTQNEPAGPFGKVRSMRSQKFNPRAPARGGSWTKSRRPAMKLEEAGRSQIETEHRYQPRAKLIDKLLQNRSVRANKLDQIISEINMDPDGDYEGRHSTRSIGNIPPKDAKLDNVNESNKKCGEDDEDEELGLKPSPNASKLKMLLSEEKGGNIDSRSLATPVNDLECLPSAPPLELSLHPLPEDDDAMAPQTETDGLPEPISKKKDVVAGSNSIPDSVALPIDLDDADLVLPVASVVPIVTDAIGTEFAPPPIQPPATSTRAPTRWVQSFFRQSSTHPAPVDESSEEHSSAETRHVDPQPRQAHTCKGMHEDQGCKWTRCKLMAAAALVVAVVAAIAVGIMVATSAEISEPADPDGPEINMQTKYPNCQVDNLHWLNDDACDGAKYNIAECGWDGGDCLFEKISNKECSGSIGSIWTNKKRAWCQEKCMEQGITCEAYDFTPSSGKCRIFSKFQSERNNVLSNCWRTKQKTIPNEPIGEDSATCRVVDRAKLGDGHCDGGQYNVEECDWDGGDCNVFGWPDCHVDNPDYINDGICNVGREYNSAECGYDGGDCKFYKMYGKACTGAIIASWSQKTRAWCQFQCFVDGDKCKAYDFDSSTKRCRIFSSYFSTTSASNSLCFKRSGVQSDFRKQYPDCHVDNLHWIGDGLCVGEEYNTVECGWDGGDCIDFNKQYPDCNVHSPFWLGNGQCNGGEYNTLECGWDGGDCTVDGYPDCHVNDAREIGDGTCNAGNTEECGWDGGDCLFDEYSDKKCNGSVRSTWSDKSRAWCQNKCLDEGSSCKAYDIDVWWEDGRGRCRIFSSYSSKSSKTGSRCYKRKR